MSFILGNEEVLSAFQTAAKTGRHSHAYIIEGEEGSGKLTLARAIAATLTCPNDKACFTCPSCMKIMQGIHQDVKEIRRAEGDSLIKLDAIREMVADAYIKPAECDKKIFIVDEAQRTLPVSQNALLQLFEEPPRNVVIFLLTPTRNLLLPTLKSRAVTLKTEVFSSELIRSEIAKRYPDRKDDLDEAVLIADGVLGKAIGFMESEDERAAVELTKRYFTRLSERVTYAELSAILAPEVAKNKERLLAVMGYFTLAIRDVLALSSGYGEKAVFFADGELLRILADRLGKEKLLAAYETVYRIIRDFNKINVNLAMASISMTLSDDFGG